MAISASEIVPDSIIPLLQIIRKIEKCNVLQLSEVLKQLTNLLHIEITITPDTSSVTNESRFHVNKNNAESLLKYQNHFDVFMNEILEFICHNHHRFTTKLFHDFASILPHDMDLDLDDTIAKSAEYHIKPLTLIKLPTAISIKICTYLSHSDHINLELTSRSLCIIARNPNSRCECYIRFNHTKPLENRICFQERYSRLRKFRIWFDIALQIPMRWGNTIHYLDISGMISNASPFDTKIYFKHLHTFRASIKHPHALFCSQMNHHSLVILHLGFCTMNNNMCEAICKCIHLTHLTLLCVEYDATEAQLINMIPEKHNPLNELENIEIDWSLNGIANFVHFILSGDFAAKTLVINSDPHAYTALIQDEINNVPKIYKKQLRNYGIKNNMANAWRNPRMFCYQFLNFSWLNLFQIFDVKFRGGEIQN
eukprot:495450_1